MLWRIGHEINLNLAHAFLFGFAQIKGWIYAVWLPFAWRHSLALG